MITPYFYILDKSFKPVYYLDSFESIVWTDRFQEAGDFEIVLPFTTDTWSAIDLGFYVYCSVSEHMMVVEQKQAQESYDSGLTMTLSGRSLESLLERRVMWEKTTISLADPEHPKVKYPARSLQIIVNRVLDDNFVNTYLPDRSKSATDPRHWDNFEIEENFLLRNLDFNATSGDMARWPPPPSGCTTAYLEEPFTVECGENIYDFIKDLCSQCGIGFKVRVWPKFSEKTMYTEYGDPLNKRNYFFFTLYTGVTRCSPMLTSANNVTPNATDKALWRKRYGVPKYVAFSSVLGNVVSANFSVDNTHDVTVSLCEGAEVKENGPRYRVAVFKSGKDGLKGMDRRETFVNANSTTKRKEDGTDMSDSDYTALLKRHAAGGLSGSEDFHDVGECELDSTQSYYTYGEDYELGDEVIVENHALRCTARVMEVVISIDNSGVSIVPGFSLEQILTTYSE